MSAKGGVDLGTPEAKGHGGGRSTDVGQPGALRSVRVHGLEKRVKLKAWGIYEMLGMQLQEMRPGVAGWKGRRKGIETRAGIAQNGLARFGRPGGSNAFTIRSRLVLWKGF